eukprot:5661035-Alexandrium_andersonii.AAC.1
MWWPEWSELSPSWIRASRWCPSTASARSTTCAGRPCWERCGDRPIYGYCCLVFASFTADSR